MLRFVLASVVAGVLATAAPALAGTREQIYKQCQNGALTGSFTAKQIRDARNNIPTDIDQYSNCRDVLARALAAKAGGGGRGGGRGSSGGAGGAGSGGGGGGGGVALDQLSDSEVQALVDAGKSGNGPVAVGGQAVVPGAAGFTADAVRNRLPASLIVVLALLALAAAAGLAPSARTRLRTLDLATIRRRVLSRGR